jgi:hypothetical protein
MTRRSAAWLRAFQESAERIFAGRIDSDMGEIRLEIRNG